MFQVEDIAAQSQSYVFVAEGWARTSELHDARFFMVAGEKRYSPSLSRYF